MRALLSAFVLVPLIFSGCATAPEPQESAVQAVAEATAGAAMALTEVVAKSLEKLHFSRGDVRRLREALAKAPTTPAKNGRPAEVTLKNGLKATCTPGECVIPFPMAAAAPGKGKIQAQRVEIHATGASKLHLKAENVAQMQAALDKARQTKSPQPAGEAFLCTSSECQPRLPTKLPTPTTPR